MRALFLVLLVFCYCNSAAYAAPDDHYYFVKLNSLHIDDVSNVDDLTALGITYGAGLSDRFWYELDVTIANQGGKFKTDKRDGQYSIYLLGGYLAYRERFTQSFYGKVKAGVLLERIEIDDFVENTLKRTDGTEISAGVGVGWLLLFSSFNVSIEIEAAIIEDNITMYGLGFRVLF